MKHRDPTTNTSFRLGAAPTAATIMAHAGVMVIAKATRPLTQAEGDRNASVVKPAHSTSDIAIVTARKCGTCLPLWSSRKREPSNPQQKHDQDHGELKEAVVDDVERVACEEFRRVPHSCQPRNVGEQHDGYPHHQTGEARTRAHWVGKDERREHYQQHDRRALGSTERVLDCSWMRLPETVACTPSNRAPAAPARAVT